jgi:putative Mg2+ transporter-C (MgtC) family protein
MALEFEVLLRVLLAGLLGAAVGFDRQRSNKPAGLRTHMLVAIGAALFAGAGVLVLADFSSGSNAISLDIIRVIAATATGIGFIGAGVIFQSGGNVQGITTAAGIWVTAGIGLLAGLGMILLAIGGALIAVLVIAILSSEVVPGTDS